MTLRRPVRRVQAVVLGIVVGLPPIAALGDQEADALLSRLPSDTSLALVVEDLGEHLQHLSSSRFARQFTNTRLIADWLESEEGARLLAARRDIEVGLDATLLEMADGLLGEAVVLSLHLAPDASPGDARGLLQTVVTDPELLRRFLAVADRAELDSGDLLRVVPRSHAGVTYSVRDFGDGRPDEAYALLDDQTFIWTNDERLLIEVIDRTLRPGEPTRPGDRILDQVHRALPEQTPAQLLVDSKFLRRLSEVDPNTPRLDELPRPIADALGAIDGLGLAFEWRSGPVLHLVELLDPSRLPAPVRSWAARSGDSSALLPLIPPSSLLAGAGHVDFEALLELIVTAIPKVDQHWVEGLRVAAQGVLLGRAPEREILPALGPGVVGWVGPPSPDQPIRTAPSVLVIAIADPVAAEAIANGLRTVLAFISLDEDRRPPLRLVTEDRGEAQVTALLVGDDRERPQIAFSVTRGLLVVGNNLDAVAEVLAPPGTDELGDRPEALDARDRLFPEATTFAYLDLDAARDLLSTRGAEIARSIDEHQGAATDSDSPRAGLDRLIELIALFRGAYATTEITEDASTARHRLGLIVAD